MTTPNDDMAILRTRLESWTARVPKEFEAFHQKRDELLKQIRSLSRVFPRRDPAEAASVTRQFLNLEGDLPVLEELAAALQRTRAEVTEFSAASSPDSQIRPLIQDWSQYWLSLLDAIPRTTVDRKGALPFLFQAQKIEGWANSRRRALAILSEAAALRDRTATHPERKQEIEKAIGSWREAFVAEKIDASWLTEAETILGRFRTAEPEKPAPEKTEPPPIPEPKSDAQPPKEATPSETVPHPQPTEESPQLLTWRIDQLLAECRDLVEALEKPRGELEKFESRQWRLGDQPAIADLRALCQEITAFRDSLLAQAGKECDQRMEQLQLRWQWFQAVYGARPEIDDLIRQAQAGRPDAAHPAPDGARQLKTFLRTLNTAEQLIYANVNADRSKLSEFVKRSAEKCRARMKELRAQARLTAVDAALAVIERQIPDDPSPQLDGVESFARLEKCHQLERELETKGEENRRRQQEALDKAAKLRRLASTIGGEQAHAIAAEIPAELPTDRSLEQTAADLNRLGQLLETERVRVRNMKTAELTKLRKDNVAWSRLLGAFTMEAEAFITSEPAPEQLDELQMAVEREQEYRQRIAGLTARAARELAERRQRCDDWLREHVTAPAFPARKSAEEYLADLDALPPFAETPKREDFSLAFEAVSNAEAFIDSIEAERRAVPDKIRDLEQQFEQLVNDWGARSYRPDLFRRAAAQLAGMQKALDSQLWQALDYQLGQTKTLIAALRADALLRIGAEVEQLVEQLRNAAKTSKDDPEYILKIETALRQLEEEGHLDPPSGAMRIRLRNLRDRRAAPYREARAK